MSDKENNIPESTTFRQENAINSFQVSNVKQLINTKENKTKNVMSQPGLRAANLNQFKKVEKEAKSAKKDTSTVKMTAIEKEIENVRHSPSKGEVLPSFVEHERKSKIHIHHKPSGPAVQSPVLPTKEESDKLKDQLKASETEKQALNEKIEAAETKNQEKTKQLKALRLQASSQTKQLTELNLKVRHIDEYKARIQSLKLQIQEQQDMYKELVDILSNANETGLSFEQELQPKEDEIEELLNQISVVNYRISELKEAKE